MRTNFLLLFCLFLAWPSRAWSEVYLTKDEALELVFGTDCEVKYTPQKVNSEINAILLKKNLSSKESELAHFFSCTNKTGKVTYALIDSEIGKHLPITYIVGVSPKGEVTRVEIMVFREIRGGEIKQKRFTRQFERKVLEDKLKVGNTIKNVTGATLSSRAITKGAKRALVIWNHIYKERV